MSHLGLFFLNTSECPAGDKRLQEGFDAKEVQGSELQRYRSLQRVLGKWSVVPLG